MKSIKIYALILLALALVDVLSTLWEISLGLATEWNPIMAHVWTWGPVWFVVVKMAATGMALVGLILIAEDKPGYREFIRIAMVGLIVIMVVLDYYHFTILRDAL